MHYKKLPKGTSRNTVAGILAIGCCLGYGITITGFVTIYALIGLFAAYFYPSSGIGLTSAEASYISILALSSAITCAWLTFLAYDMNILSKKALGVSQKVIFPITFTAFLVANQKTFIDYQYHLDVLWVLAVAIVIPLCGILPYLFLRTTSAKKVHSR